MMRLKIVGTLTCIVAVLGIFIVYTNISIGKEPYKTNHETSENAINNEKIESKMGLQVR